MKFSTVKLGDYLYIKGRIGWKGLKKSEYINDGNFRIINGESLTKDGIDWSKSGFITRERYEESPEIMLREGDILISKDGTIGKLGYIDHLEMPSTVASGIFVLRNLKPEIINTRFIYNYLSSIYFKNFITARTEGSVIPHLYQKDFVDLDFPLPKLDIQDKIVDILDAIAYKIELNNKINNNLEEQARALFRNLFSDNNEYKTVTLGNVTKNIRDRVGDDNVTVLSAVNTGKLQPSDTFFTKRVYSKDISKYITVKEGSFAYNPARINIGSIGINDLGITGCVSPVYVVFDVDSDYRSFFEFYFKTAIFKAETMLRASGSVRQSLNYNDFTLIDIKYPDRGTAQFFNKFWTKQKSIISHLNRENERLSELRDTLLPKLMSGEIDVSNITI